MADPKYSRPQTHLSSRYSILDKNWLQIVIFMTLLLLCLFFNSIILKNPGSSLYKTTSPMVDEQNKEIKAASCSNGIKVQPLTDDEAWIEVSNKSNQTPSHWVYDDMITKDQVILIKFTTLITY